MVLDQRTMLHSKQDERTATDSKDEDEEVVFVVGVWHQSLFIQKGGHLLTAYRFSGDSNTRVDVCSTHVRIMFHIASNCSARSSI